MRFGLGDVVLAVGGGLLVRWALGQKQEELEEPIVRDKFAPQPMAVYFERIVWQLTQDFDVPRVRRVRNLLNERYEELQECYRRQMPPDVVARHVERVMSGEESSIAPADVTPQSCLRE